MLIEQIDDSSFQTLQRRFGNFLDAFGSAVQSGLFAIIDLEADFCGDLQLITEGNERFANEFFIRVRAIKLRCIEECEATLHGSANDRNSLLLVYSWPITKAQAPTTER